MLVTASVSRLVVPLMLNVLKPLRRSAAASPSTASPVIVKAYPEPVTVPLVVMVLAVSVVLAPKVTAPLKICVPDVVTLFAKVLVPVTSKLDVPVLVMAGLLPLMLKLPTVRAFCKSKVALLMLKLLLLLPKVPAPLSSNVPPLMTVDPV